jgi:hypothetical protein
MLLLLFLLVRFLLLLLLLLLLLQARPVPARVYSREVGAAVPAAPLP